MDSNTNTIPQAVERPAWRSGDLFGSLVRIKGGLKRTARVMPVRVRNPNKPGEYMNDWVQVDRDLKHPRANKWFRHWPISKLEVLPNIEVSQMHKTSDAKSQ